MAKEKPKRITAEQAAAGYVREAAAMVTEAITQAVDATAAWAAIQAAAIAAQGQATTLASIDNAKDLADSAIAVGNLAKDAKTAAKAADGAYKLARSAVRDRYCGPIEKMESVRRLRALVSQYRDDAIACRTKADAIVEAQEITIEN